MSRLAQVPGLGNRGTDLRRSLSDDLIAAGRGASPRGLDSYAKESAGVAYGAGRQAGVAATPRPARVYASEILDGNTCPACYGVDGKEYASVEDSLEDYPAGGYFDCDGGLLCRGTRVFVWEAEPPTLDEPGADYDPDDPTDNPLTPDDLDPGVPGSSGPSPYVDPKTGETMPWDLSAKDRRFVLDTPTPGPQFVARRVEIEDRAALNEARVSDAVTDLVEGLENGSLTGYEYRLKIDPSRMTAEKLDEARVRVANKLAEDLEKLEARGVTPTDEIIQALADEYGDAVRYTIKFDPENYAQGVDDALAALRERFHEVKVGNAWADPKPGYRGINTNFQDRETGQIFEVQLHTPETSRLAKTDSHDWYEISRNKAHPPEYQGYATRRFQELWRPHVEKPPPGRLVEIASTRRAPLPIPRSGGTVAPVAPAPEIIRSAKAIQQAGIPHKWVDEWVEAGGPVQGVEVYQGSTGNLYGSGSLPVAKGEWLAYRDLSETAQARYRDLRREGYHHQGIWSLLQEEGLR